ncbi:MAG: DUF4493 domain-containing protein [Muribaculaceae bacterium]|nr:DUF4493 domain-containing protein [Muribaculaceae bacterium]
MKRINNIYISALMGLGLISCANEAPFDANNNSGSGKILTSSLSLHVKAETPRTRVNENGIPSQDDFAVKFFKKGETENPVKVFESYATMPEIVELPEDEYYISVSYGGTYEGGGTAAFNAPHYAGLSSEFKINANEIVDNIQPIVCKLQNVRVSVNFDTSLVTAMSKDSKVTVKVGESSATTLDFTLNTTQDGYFTYATGSNTLIATFDGEVQGEKIRETRTFDNVERGNYYQITFKLNYANSAGPGNIEPGDNQIDISASVTYTDLSDNDNFNDVTPDDEEVYIEDDMRPENGKDPNQGDNNNPGQGDPNNPGGNPDEDDPKDNPGEDSRPTIVGNDGIVMGVPAIEPETCSFTVYSKTGITGFTVVIDSEKLDETALEEVNLKKELNLVEPGDEELAANIKGLGFPIREEVKGKTEVTLSIEPDFLGLLKVLGTCQHKFIITVTDAGGSITETLILEYK